jgi:hypothetical protein
VLRSLCGREGIQLLIRKQVRVVARSDDLIAVPELPRDDELGIALEIEAGRGTQGNAIYRDLIQTSLLIDARFLALAVLIDYGFKSAGKTTSSPDYRKTISLLDAIYASDRLRLPLEGVLILGY